MTRHILFVLGTLMAVLICPAVLSAATLLTPTRGEILTSGSIYTITWTPSPKDFSCKIEYSIGKHKIWKKIVDNYSAADSSYNWTVTVPPKNVSRCILKITTYDFRGRKRSVDRSGRFSIEVVRLLEPNGHYPLRSKSKKTIRWVTHQTQRQVSYVQLSYSTNGGKYWKKIVTLEGNPELYFWSVPQFIKKTKRAKIRVTLRDENGHSVGRDQSDASFQILKPTASRRTIFYNAKILTMEGDKILNGAICINGDTIESLGKNKVILAKRDKNTELVNLNGLTLIPGFIDPHTHLFNDAEWNGYTLDEVQWLALTNGVTGVGNIGDLPDQIERYIEYADKGNMRIRSYHYLCYTDHCGNLCGDWYEDYLPRVEYAPNVWVNGIKLFVERSVCPSIKPVFSKELLDYFTPLGRAKWKDSILFFTNSELADVISSADEKGYQVAIHAIGELGIQTTLDAIDAALEGSSNIHRHMIFHNHFLRNDMLYRYVDSDILGILEPARPGQAVYYADHVGKYNMKYFKRWKELLDSGAPLAGNSDWPYGSLNPIRRLDQFVTSYVPVYPDRPDQSLPVLEALKLMTIRAAYAMQCEVKMGSLKPGKSADLVVLSDNPLEIDPANIEDIQVLMTMVDGWVEYWSEYLNPYRRRGWYSN
jgi:predicted amidohydrolase YtcJ